MVVLAFLLVMRVGWKVFTACLAAFVVPLAAYALIFFSEHGQLNITDSTGLFLWSRTMMVRQLRGDQAPAQPGPALPGEPARSPGRARPGLVRARDAHERTPADYLWAPGAWYRVDAHPGVNAYNNKLAMQFAERAIVAQPLDYLKTVGKEVLLTFFATDRPTDYLAHAVHRGPACRPDGPVHAVLGDSVTRTPTPTRTWSSRGRTSCSCTSSPSGSPDGSSSW